jgi:hypothetical protein
MGLQIGGTANEVTGNLTLAMNALAGMNSYVLFHPRRRRLEILIRPFRARRTSPQVQSMMNQTAAIMNAVMKAGKSMVKNCAGA